MKVYKQKPLNTCNRHVALPFYKTFRDKYFLNFSQKSNLVRKLIISVFKEGILSTI